MPYALLQPFLLKPMSLPGGLGVWEGSARWSLCPLDSMSAWLQKASRAGLLLNSFTYAFPTVPGTVPGM